MLSNTNLLWQIRHGGITYPAGGVRYLSAGVHNNIQQRHGTSSLILVMWITLKPLKPREMLKRCSKGTCTEVTGLIHQEGFCTKSLTSAALPLWSPPPPSTHTQQRLCNTVTAASPRLPHALRDDSDHQNTTLGGFQAQELSWTQKLLYGEEEPDPKRKATTLMKSHSHKDLQCS